MRANTQADWQKKHERRTATKLKHERKRKRLKQVVQCVIPAGGQAFGVCWKGTWKTEEE